MKLPFRVSFGGCAGQNCEDGHMPFVAIRV